MRRRFFSLILLAIALFFSSVVDAQQKEISSLLPFTLSAMARLAPSQDHTVMGSAIAEVVEAEDPLFLDDKDKLRTTSLVVAIAFREGSLKPSVLGDCEKSKPGEPCKGRPKSFCTMQINDSMGGSDWLNENPLLCIQKGMQILRKSVKTCPDHPVAWYSAGRTGACTNERAIRISKDRMTLAHWLWLKRDKT